MTTARTDTPGLEYWRVDEDDYGEPMVFHRHVSRECPAHVIGRHGERRLAQCSECMQSLELVGTRATNATD
jgi:hypothetical protein